MFIADTASSKQSHLKYEKFISKLFLKKNTNPNRYVNINQAPFSFFTKLDNAGGLNMLFVFHV